MRFAEAHPKIVIDFFAATGNVCVSCHANPAEISYTNWDTANTDQWTGILHFEREFQSVSRSFTFAPCALDT
ncbi:hypothetical protein CCGE525_23720 (plasmid) [Rhizobium jaguaris]|uniref:Uncharacterized protein n=1 Tax=Rhizobium jaguaris TaxID=1312183 RepID=A0A387FT82_9HYPH|nr:hypothetical protein CCGE525_23720 [Rhizobium jaguaris]